MRRAGIGHNKSARPSDSALHHCHHGEGAVSYTHLASISERGKRMNSSGKVLILGASAGIGGEVARRLVADNWQVRALKRGAQI